MKENNLNRVIGWSGLLLTSLLSTSALADNIGTSAEELGLSDYRHFVIGNDSNLLIVFYVQIMPDD
ncbi:hypothetical protein EVY10_06815 [Escherichia coli]|nr:hypothetical protein [Escherichia coli]RYI27795.1 hypothetical protein EVY10_06815 [Escherichia coli]